MKLFITGRPKSGKSTILSELVSGVALRRGFITKELVKDQRRTGFIVVDMNGQSAVLAQTHNSTSIQVGRFYVQPDILAEFTRNLSNPKIGELLYIDEIGQMQLHCNEFRSLVEMYLDAPNDFIATITSIYSDDITMNIFNKDDALFFYLNELNRNEVTKALSITLHNRVQFNEMSKTMQKAVVGYANNYLKEDLFIPFGKLFTNTIRYLLEDRINVISTDTYVVTGNTNKHVVIFGPYGEWSCDCPLSKGKEPYIEPMECSHLQSVQLYRIEQYS